MKRSNEPPFWALFGAGGMLSALVAPVLVFITGVALPLGWLLPPSAWSHARVLALLQNPLAKLALVVVVMLFLFHGCHRTLHSLHDVGVHPGPFLARMFYGFAAAGTVAAAVLLLKIGF